MGFHSSDDEYLDEIKIYSRKDVAALKAENALLRDALESLQLFRQINPGAVELAPYVEEKIAAALTGRDSE